MVNKLLIILTFASFTLFTGCGDKKGTIDESVNAIDSNKKTTNNVEAITNDTSTNMIIGKSYIISSGGEIIKTSSNANVTVETDVSTNITTAILTTGTATCSNCSLE